MSDRLFFIVSSVGIIVIGVALFFLGIWVGEERDDGVEVRMETLPVASGDFEDVELVMRNSSGTFYWLCDLHLSSDPDPENTAECEFRP